MPEQQQSEQDLKALEAHLTAGQSLGQVRGLNKTMLELCYAVGSNAYKRRDFTTAYRAFLFLCLHDHRDPEHWVALATVFAAQNQSERALPLLTIAWNLDPSAQTSYRLAEAYIRCEEKEQARVLLRYAQELLEKQKNQTGLLARVTGALDRMRNETGSAEPKETS